MRKLGILVGFIAATGLAFADVQQGIDAYQKGDYKTALEELKKAAGAGDANGQFYLGEIYDKGRGVPQDFAEAAKWYRAAADQNQVDAQEVLCTRYFFGQATLPKDPTQAVKYCPGAAKAGKEYAAFLAGYLFERGQGTTADPKKAAEYYKISAEKGNVSAQEALGSMYFFGEGVAQDYALAAKWNKAPAEKGRDFPQFLLGYMYELGRGVDKNPAEAANWYRKAADQGNTRAMASLGGLYLDGKGVAKDTEVVHQGRGKGRDFGFHHARLGLLPRQRPAPRRRRSAQVDDQSR
jgi:uncharacterized protein